MTERAWMFLSSQVLCPQTRCRVFSPYDWSMIDTELPRVCHMTRTWTLLCVSHLLRLKYEKVRSSTTLTSSHVLRWGFRRSSSLNYKLTVKVKDPKWWGVKWKTNRKSKADTSFSSVPVICDKDEELKWTDVLLGRFVPVSCLSRWLHLDEWLTDRQSGEQHISYSQCKVSHIPALNDCLPTGKIRAQQQWLSNLLMCVLF